MFSTGLSLLNPRCASLKVAPNLFYIVWWLFKKVVRVLEAGGSWGLMDASVTCRQEGSWRLVFSPFFPPSFAKVGITNPQIGISMRRGGDQTLRLGFDLCVWTERIKITCKSDTEWADVHVFLTRQLMVDVLCKAATTTYSLHSHHRENCMCLIDRTC